MVEILSISSGLILADRRQYAVTVRYPHEKPMIVHFVGPSTCEYGPVSVSFAGYSSLVVNPARLGPFGRAWILAFYGTTGHADGRPCGQATGFESRRASDITCTTCRGVVS